jgi:hypothetical protein
MCVGVLLLVTLVGSTKAWFGKKKIDQTLPSKRGQNGLKTLVKGFPFIVEFLPPRLNF